MMKKLIYYVTAAIVISLGGLLEAQTSCEDDFEFVGSDWNHYFYDAELLAKAQPDECFFGIGDGNNIWPFPGDCNDCYALGGTPKVNQAYVWGLTKSGDNLWFGTAPNVHCMVMGAYLGSTSPVITDSYVCEFGSSQLVPPLPPELGDARPPDFFVYNIVTKTLTKKNLSILMAGSPHSDRVMSTIGIRSAGAVDNIVFLAGPGFGGINLFAFNANTGAFLGSTTRPESNIRKWLTVDGILYTAAAEHVLKWTGDVGDPFQFDVVGNLPGQGGAELAFHDGRIFISTWPGGELGGGGDQAGLWMSPLVDPCGLTTADVNNWVKVWTASNYEPDPIIAATYGGGAVESFDGWLYWGTMHVPMMSTMGHITVYGEPADEMDYINTALKCHRAISIFRGRNFNMPGEEVQLLYGESELPVYDPMFGGWISVPTGHGSPLYGASGFDNFFNNYTWTMAVYDDQLFVGTMDWSYLALGDIGDLGDALGIGGSGLIELIIPLLLPEQCLGADLYRFASSNAPAVPVSLSGIGNYTNYGIRTMVSDDSLYMGTSNPMNLLTDPYDDEPEGGWELKRLMLCETALAGDINGDKKVDFLDFAFLANNWLRECCSCE